MAKKQPFWFVCTFCNGAITNSVTMYHPFIYISEKNDGVTDTSAITVLLSWKRLNDKDVDAAIAVDFLGVKPAKEQPCAS